MILSVIFLSNISLFFFFFKLIVELLFLVEESEKVKVKSLSGVRLFVTPCTVVYWAPLSMGFSRQGCRGGLPFPFPGDLPDPGTEPMSPALAGRFFTTAPLGKFLAPSWGIEPQAPA